MSRRSFLLRDNSYKVAHRILGSKAEYISDLSVPDVERVGVNDFDMVLYLGVSYHLRDPLLALAKLRKVMKEGALIVIEGEVVTNIQTPLAYYHYKRPYGQDRSNWWIPTISCLREWIESSFFEIVMDAPATETHNPWSVPDLITGRHTFVARAVSRKDNLWAFPDADLRKYDPQQLRQFLLPPLTQRQWVIH